MTPAERQRFRPLWLVAPALLALALVLVAGAPRLPEAIVLLLCVLVLTMALWRWQQRDAGQRLRTLGGLLDALREGDYSVRAAQDARDADGLLARFNALAQRLQDEQRDSHESLQLLSKTLAALDGAVFAFEQDQRLRLINPAGERLLGVAAQQAIGQSAQALGLAALFDVPSGSIQAHAFAGQQGRWQIGHAALRSRSQAGRLLLVQPMERALREEEAQAFRRLLRVLSHEINNSLTPIASIADTLARLLAAAPQALDAELQADLHNGLGVIEQRSAALQRFLGGYARLARLPAPVPAPVALAPLCARVQRLLDDARVQVEVAPSLHACADADQLEQVLINLLRNALEAGGSAPVTLRASADGASVSIEVCDGGAGLPPSDNLFVPFFTTKPGGSGIGLVLSRQILEAQGGSLSLEARTDAQGSVATLRLPLA
ncbi:ATP-binding protein [Xanthomonas sontii]|uniref:histidine kinase n=1 Tax=Xanthomonas sontii TaxID=2650745 RepID=A0A6N7Q7D7_9XANT|nr:ATP-binding protein [Xanthomonas sontii]MRH74526.1 ATP-binding protein [Xanthomonas sontii]